LKNISFIFLQGINDLHILFGSQSQVRSRCFAELFVKVFCRREESPGSIEQGAG